MGRRGVSVFFAPRLICGVSVPSIFYVHVEVYARSDVLYISMSRACMYAHVTVMRVS
jgi:hypothetical protein